MSMRFAGPGQPRVRPELDDLRALPHDGGMLRLSRVWPRRDRRLTLEYRDAAGGVVGGQWAARVETLESTAERTPGTELVAVGSARVLLHPGGVDRQLPALAGLLGAPGATLVSHRVERRALVRMVEAYGTTDLRVLHLRDVAWVAQAAQIAHDLAGGALHVPVASWTDAERGIVAFDRLAGDTLHDRLVAGDGDAVRAAAASGRALRVLHDAQGPRDHLPVRGAPHDLTRLDDWIERIAPHAPGLACLVEARLGPVAARVQGLGARSPVAVHGDFHAGRIVVTGDDAVGVTDWDGLALGDRALDLAGLAVHLELRVLERRCSPAIARAALRSAHAGYEVGPELGVRIAAYADLLRLRRACANALRPGGAQLSALLLRRVGRAP
jgi:aminoglycoside phosphotransferase